MNASHDDGKLITSPQNPYVKDLVALRKDGNVRRERQAFFLEGRRGVLTALELAHTRIGEVIVCEKILGEDAELNERLAARGAPVVRVSKDVFKKIADVETPQGVAAVVRMPEWTFEDLLKPAEPFFVVACGIQDPGNLGTLIRTAEACGATGLVTLEHTADPFNAKVVRSTAGGLLALPIVRLSTPSFLKLAEENRVRLAAACAHDGVSFREFDWKRRPLGLCIGSEAHGLSEEILAAKPERVTIPLRGKAESLNAAVSASVLLFEAQR